MVGGILDKGGSRAIRPGRRDIDEQENGEDAG